MGCRRRPTPFPQRQDRPSRFRALKAPGVAETMLRRTVRTENSGSCDVGANSFTPTGAFSGLKMTDFTRSEEHTSELQSLRHLVCRLLLEKKKKKQLSHTHHRELNRSTPYDASTSAR